MGGPNDHNPGDDVRAQNTAPSILFALLMFAAGQVAAADPKPESLIPPFCKVSQECNPEKCSSRAKGEVPIPKKDEAAACNACGANGMTGRCDYWQPTLQWLCCSKSPYSEMKK